mmetsp:Transcript_42712/g.89312  ORF Transcript_42712/g.89312 Transcript_42712/m.89312 type:complete len:238 (-) Transcript_42712:214-927(-)
MGFTTASSSFCRSSISSTSAERPSPLRNAVPDLAAWERASRSSSSSLPSRRFLSASCFFTLAMNVSRFALASIFRRAFLSCSAKASASRTIFSICFSLRRPLSFLIVIFSVLPVPFSSADTTRMPLASISNVTSIWGVPRGAGGMPVTSNWPSLWQSLTMARSPSYTAMFTTGWLSDVVVKLSVFLVGMTVLRSMSFVSTPPSVSIPSVSGVTSSSSRSCVSCPPSPDRMPPWTAAP